MDGMVLDPSYSTIMKTRILAGDDNTTKQQIIRIDRDREIQLSAEKEQRLLAYLKRILPDIDALIVSDYGYGIFTKKILAFIRHCARDKIVAVDSRYHMAAFKGATIITPNQSEAEQITGIAIQDEASLHRAGRKLLRLIKCRAALITQGNKGMTLFEPDKTPLHIPVVGQRQDFRCHGRRRYRGIAGNSVPGGRRRFPSGRAPCQLRCLGCRHEARHGNACRRGTQGCHCRIRKECRAYGHTPLQYFMPQEIHEP